LFIFANDSTAVSQRTADNKNKKPSEVAPPTAVG